VVGDDDTGGDPAERPIFDRLVEDLLECRGRLLWQMRLWELGEPPELVRARDVKARIRRLGGGLRHRSAVARRTHERR
jgi:hypothetical protein